MEAMLGISLCSHLYLNYQKRLDLLLLMSSLQQNWSKGQNRFCLEATGVGRRGGGGGQEEEMTQTMYAHVNK
jgi:hypothetical protein